MRKESKHIGTVGEMKEWLKDVPGSDDDLCSQCRRCDYQPGEMSGCNKGCLGQEDVDGYVRECGQFQYACAEAAVAYVVKDEHTLGYIFDVQPALMGVLSSKKNGHHPNGGPVSIFGAEIRPATVEDFAAFRVAVPPSVWLRAGVSG